MLWFICTIGLLLLAFALARAWREEQQARARDLEEAIRTTRALLARIDAIENPRRRLRSA